MPILHPSGIWKTTGAWDSVDVLFKVKSRTGNDYALGQSEEEVVTPLVMQYAQSYKDLPISVYQIHWKYRDELRAKSGIMRGREFYMKDMYSFHTSQQDFEDYYGLVKKKYIELYKKMGLTAKVTEASGGDFTEKISYEFEVLTDAGEDEILFCENCDFCVNTEIAKLKAGAKCPNCKKGTLQKAKAAEVGNVFDLGQKYGKDFKLAYVDRDNKQQYPIMGCYGLGISRVMGVIIEKFNDDKGILWPEAVAPAQVHLVSIGNDPKIKTAAEKLYQQLSEEGVEVLFDDREESPGAKLADADLIGVPKRLVISEKTLAQNGVELKARNSDKTELIKLDSAVKALK
jgi:prolyl-tRNA synthetase